MPRPHLKCLFRISLRTLLVLTTLFCIWLGFKVHQVKQQQAAVEWVEEAGGSLRYDYEYEYSPPPGPNGGATS